MSIYLHRELAEQALAARVAHMSSGSILIAQFKVDAALRSIEGGSKAATQLHKALDALRDAQEGLDRAKFSGVPWHRQARKIALGRFVAEIGAELNREFDKEVVTERSLRACLRAPQVAVRAGEERLRCALRDATLSTWLLGKVQATKLAVVSTAQRATIQVESRRTELPTAVGSELLAILSDPGQYLSLPDKPAARGLGFYLPRKLVEEMGGSMTAKLIGVEHRLRVRLDFPRV